MNAPTIVTKEIAGKTWILESGLLAKQANAAVTVRCGDTMVFATVTTDAPREGIDFFPLTVDFRKANSPQGKFPAAFLNVKAGLPKKKSSPPAVPTALSALSSPKDSITRCRFS